jgi:hypothetical protein
MDSDQEKMATSRKADQEKMAADKEDFLARMNEESREANQELMARLTEEDKQANQELLARMDTYHEKRMAMLDACFG